MKGTITESERQQLLGLITLGRQHRRAGDEVADAAARLLGRNPEVLEEQLDGWYDVLDDGRSGRGVDWLLSGDGVTVVPDPEIEPPNPGEWTAAEMDAMVDRVVQLRAALRTAAQRVEQLGASEDLTKTVIGITDALQQDEQRERGEIDPPVAGPATRADRLRGELVHIAGFMKENGLDQVTPHSGAIFNSIEAALKADDRTRV